MTIERKLIVGLDDLSGLIFECRHAQCKARAKVPADHGKVPQNCPGCGREWMPSSERDTKISSSIYVKFVEILGMIRAQEPTNEWPKFRILLEFDEPKFLVI